MTENKTKLEVNNLRLSFWTNNGTVKAVRGISFDVKDGETLAIVGESGSGKSVTSRSIMGILAPNAIVESGEIYYDGMDLLQITEEDYNKLRGNRISMIFQDPLSSLDPIMKVGKQITEAMIANNKSRRNTAQEELSRIENALVDVSEEAGVKDKFEPQLKKLDAYLNTGNKFRGRYNDAINAIETVSKQIYYILLDLHSEEYTDDINQKISNLISDAKGVYNELTFTPEETKRVKELVAEIKSTSRSYKKIARKYNKADIKGDKETLASLEPERKKGNTILVDDLNELKERMDKKLEEKDPDFLSFGYAVEENLVNDIANEYDPEKEAELRESLNKNFLDDFVVLLSKLQAFEHKRVKGVAKDLLKDVNSDLDKLNKNFSIDYLKDRRDDLSKKVIESISRLEVRRDSFARTFTNAVDKQLASYKKVSKADYQDENELSEEELAEMQERIQGNIVRIFTRLKHNLEHKIALEHDTVAEARELIAYLDQQSEDLTYRLTDQLAESRAIDLMDEVGIDEPRKRFEQYPFEFSGGMRQRVVIAIALSSDPDLLICDEPTTALDVTIQAQILELIKEMKKKRNFSVIFITHDLGVVANMADRIAVMYAGKIVEVGTVDEIFYEPAHPYTWGLLSSMPDLETSGKLVSIPGTPPNMIDPPQGDAFAARNRYAMEIDFEEQPPFFQLSETHKAATWLLHPKAPKVTPPEIVTERIERAQERMRKEASDKEAADE